MANILSIETATNVLSVSLSSADKLIAVKESYQDKSHSFLLACFINDMLKESGIKMSQIDAVAISKGPGSYTGLRIGTSVAKGICFALDIPLIAVDTLQAMAHGMEKYNFYNYFLCPTIDARRMEVYFLLSRDQEVVMDTNFMIIDENSFEDILKSEKIIFFGNGAKKCRSVLSHKKNAIFVDHFTPSAVIIGELALQKYDKTQFEDLAYFEPYYLKEFRTIKPKSS